MRLPIYTQPVQRGRHQRLHREPQHLVLPCAGSGQRQAGGAPAGPVSARLLRALRFVEEGVLCRHSLHPNVSDEPRDVTSFARLRQAGPRQDGDARPTAFAACGGPERGHDGR